MKTIVLTLSMLVALTFAFAVSAASPANFAGTWELDKTKSQNLPRFWQDVESLTWVITQTEKQVTIEPKVTGGGRPAGGPPSGGGNGGERRPGGGGGGGGGGRGFGGGMMGPVSYNLDGTETTTEGERGKSTSKGSWSKDGSVLELIVTRNFSTPNGDVTATTNEKLSLSADGKVLTDTRHSEGPRGPQDSTLIFNKKS
jgi:hypothetical protein